MLKSATFREKFKFMFFNSKLPRTSTYHPSMDRGFFRSHAFPISFLTFKYREGLFRIYRIRLRSIRKFLVPPDQDTSKSMCSWISASNSDDATKVSLIPEAPKDSLFSRIVPRFFDLVRALFVFLFSCSIRAYVMGIRNWIDYVAVPFSNFYNATHIASDGVRSNSGVAMEWNIRYGEVPGECMDILSPTGNYESTGRSILYVHGGGFVAVHRGVLHHSITPLVRAGFTVYSIDYPLAPEFKFPVPIVSVLKCLAYLRSERGITGVTLMGDSAGGALASLVAAALFNPDRDWHPEIMAKVKTNGFPTIDNLALLYSIFDLESWKCYSTWYSLLQTHIVNYCMSQYKNSPDDQVSVMEHIHKVSEYPRTMLLCGTMDPLQHSHDLFHSSLIKRGVDSTHLVLPGFHGFHGLPPPFSLGLWRTTVFPANCALIKWLSYGDESRVPVLPRVTFFEEFNFSLLLFLAALHALAAFAVSYVIL